MQERPNTIEQALNRMAEAWPSEFVARTKIEAFSGGLFSPKTMANLDSLGEGPVRVKRGSLTGYIKWPLVEWMKTKISSN